MTFLRIVAAIGVCCGSFWLAAAQGWPWAALVSMVLLFYVTILLMRWGLAALLSLFIREDS